MKACVLLFGLSPMEGVMVKNTLAGIGIPVVIPDKTQYHQPIGSFAGEKVPVMPAASRQSVLPEPVVVLCHLPSRERDRVLDTLTGANLCTGVLKAVLTPVNQYWNVIMLAEELRRERAMMRKQANR